MKTKTVFPLRTGTRSFRSLAAFRKFAAKNGCTVKKVTEGKNQMRQGTYIVGFFNTAFGGQVL